MGNVSVYLNFKNQTEEAFNYYREVFGGEFIGEIARYGDIPPSEDMPPLSDADKNLIMNIGLSIMDGFLIMGTDAPDSMGFQLTMGNNMYIMLDPDSKEETERLFVELSAGGKVEQELQVMFWGAYYGSCKDKFGVQWMFNYDLREK